MHLNFMHLAVNSMALNSLGPEVEGFSGKGRFLAIYAISAVTSFAASYAFLPHFSQGSSGTVTTQCVLLSMAETQVSYVWKHQFYPSQSCKMSSI